VHVRRPIERRLAVIVLAAGRSSRFATAGAHKLLATIDGVPMVRRAVAAAVEAGVGSVLAVTGASAEQVTAALDGLGVRIVHEPAFAEGMSRSLRRGIEDAAPDVDAVLIALGDQPSMRPDAYRRVVEAWEATGAAIVVPRYAAFTAPGHPVLFSAATFGELRAIRGDVGAREVIDRDPARVVTVDLEWPAPRDVDTADDLDAVARGMSADASRSRAPDDARIASAAATSQDRGAQ
jgi:molybdenum cofactor cytidylyltransferase